MNAELAAMNKISKAVETATENLDAGEKESLHLGEEVFYVLRGIVTQINHRQTDDDEPVTRVHTVKAHEITKADPDVASKILAVAAEERERLKAEQAGQLALGAEQAAAAREATD
jgi:hypothetical protein